MRVNSYATVLTSEGVQYPYQLSPTGQATFYQNRMGPRRAKAENKRRRAAGLPNMTAEEARAKFSKRVMTR